MVLLLHLTAFLSQEVRLPISPAIPQEQCAPCLLRCSLSVACSKSTPQPSQGQGPTVLRREGPRGVRKDRKPQTNPISNLTTK